MRNGGKEMVVSPADTQEEVDREQPTSPPCPKCGEPLTTLWLEGEWQFYRCDQHGIVVLTPNGQVPSDEPDDSKVRR